jgi:hypothetical protein
MFDRRYLYLGAAVPALMVAANLAQAANPKPVFDDFNEQVTETGVNAALTVLTIEGSGFGPDFAHRPSVALGAQTLAVLTSSNTTITATLPAGIAPGTYTLTVTNILNVTAQGEVAIGDQGATGATGAQGPQGAPGPTGATGAQGLPGATGPQGLAGANGAPGLQGATGAQGLVGPTGATGPQGLAGATGAVGPQGPTGAQGLVGPTGAQGSLGPTGGTGPQGLAGATGAVGPQGPTGAQGIAGATGATGPQGSTGAQGQTGLTGATGAQGVAGTTGATGPQGPTGAQGATGFVSLPYAAGGTGSTPLFSITDLDGAAFAGVFTGTQALQINGGLQITPGGETGLVLTSDADGNATWQAQGPQGIQGPQGLQGPQGAMGLQGSTGAAGTAGATGATGPAGAAGAKGATGATGPAGATGATGFVSLPASLSVSDANGTALSITNTGDGTPVAAAFATTSTNQTSEADGSDATLEAVNSGGSTSVTGGYGSAGIFETTNSHNSSPALYVSSAGPYGIYAGTTYQNGIAIYGEIPAGATNAAIEGYAAGTSGAGVWGEAPSSIAVTGGSTEGIAGYFTGGAGGTGYCFYSGGANWACSSDRNIKTDFHAVDGRDILRRVADLPVFNYRMKGALDPSVRWIGPTAQDFLAAFHLGTDDKTINTANEMGVTLAALQGLYQELQDRDARIAALAEDKAALDDRMGKLEEANRSLKAENSALRQEMERRLARMEKQLERSFVGAKEAAIEPAK